MISNCLVMAAAAWWMLGGQIKASWGSYPIPHFYLDTGWVEVDFTPWLDRDDPDERPPKLDLPLLYDGKWRVKPRGWFAAKQAARLKRQQERTS